MARFGWVPDLPDHRDYRYVISKPVELPQTVDLRHFMPPVYDQGQLGSCTANAIAAAIEYDQQKQKLPMWTPSRLFVYWNERNMEGTIASDSGAMIRDGIKSVAKLGAPPETDWPYDISQFTTKPSDKSYQDALAHPVTLYQSLTQRLFDLKHCLAFYGPFVIGITVYESFEQAPSGDIPMPKAWESVLGGHAILICGYDQTTWRFRFRNSWGPDWGRQGYGTLPMMYLVNTQLAADAWCLETTR